MSRSVDSRYFRDHPAYGGAAATTTAAAMIASYAIGPMTRGQMEEIVWRVKRINLTWTWKNPGGGAGGIYSAMERRRAGDAAVAVDETEVFTQLGVDSELVAWGSQFLSLDYSQNMMLGGRIAKDEAGGYWFPDAFVGFSEGGGTFVTAGIRPDDTYGGADVELILPLSSGDFSINLYAWYSGGVYEFDDPDDLEMSATLEWWEYADLSGAPAWDPATGLKANGGPGG